MCYSPKLVNVPHRGYIRVPCGHCDECHFHHSLSWTTRLSQELQYWSSSCFVTLTYNDNYVPLGLNKFHLQTFFRRLREITSLYFNGSRSIRYNMKYFACGEYGSKSFRPHYHFILFGLGSDRLSKCLILKAWSNTPIIASSLQTEINSHIYNLESSSFGFITCSSINPNRIKYVTGYIDKKLYGNHLSYHDKYFFENNFLEAPFQLSSQGLGKQFFIDNMDTLINKGFCVVDGKNVALPRYYLKLYSKINGYYSSNRAMVLSVSQKQYSFLKEHCNLKLDYNLLLDSELFLKFLKDQFTIHEYYLINRKKFLPEFKFWLEHTYKLNDGYFYKNDCFYTSFTKHYKRTSNSSNKFVRSFYSHFVTSPSSKKISSSLSFTPSKSLLYMSGELKEPYKVYYNILTAGSKVLSKNNYLLRRQLFKKQNYRNTFSHLYYSDYHFQELQKLLAFNKKLYDGIDLPHYYNNSILFKELNYAA